jgi:hypothetical protein
MVKTADDPRQSNSNPSSVTASYQMIAPLIYRTGAATLRVADSRDAQYIILGSRKQSPVGKALFGSVAQVVLLNTDRAVVIVSGSD